MSCSPIRELWVRVASILARLVAERLESGDSLLLPYGCSDATVRFAFIDTSALLSELTSGR